MQRTKLLAAALLCFGFVSTQAIAESAVVMAPGSAGGGYDAMARLPIQAMQEAGVFTDGATFTNKGGAGGTIGLSEFVNANKNNDNAIMSMGAIMVGSVRLNNSPVTLNDVTPLARLIVDYGAVGVPVDSPIKTPADLIAALKSDPGGTAIGGGSAGGVDHIAAALLAKESGVDVAKLNYIPYPGGADVVAALAGGKIKAAVSGISEFKEFAKQGLIRIIAVTSAERHPAVDAPTLKESGVNVVIGNWRGIVGAPGMSAEGKAMWLDRFAKMHESDAWKKILTAQGWDDAYLSGDEFAAFLVEEDKRQSQVLKDVGLLK